MSTWPVRPGLLFLDELPEFGPQALDSLRQRLETGEVTVTRANAHVRFPAQVQLVAAMNPCRCGVGGLGRGACGKAPRCQQSYQGRVSGPLLDRIDLTVEVPPVTAADLALPPPAEGAAEVAGRPGDPGGAGGSGRARRPKRPGRAGAPNPLNARAEGAWLDHIAALDAPAKALMAKAAETRTLTARGWTRTLRLARTIADLEGGGPVRRVHVAEALIYRRMGPGSEGVGEARLTPRERVPL